LKTVKAYTLKGKLLCFIIHVLCFPLSIIKGKKWLKPRVFEENPWSMTLKDIIYFTYKYYYHSPLIPENDQIVEHFRSKVESKNKEFQTLVSVSIGGDLMPYKLIKPENTNYLWDEIGPDFFASDIVFANLETPFVENRPEKFVPEVMLNNMLFNTDQNTFDVFNGNKMFKGFDVLSVANNHSIDQGIDGLNKTIEKLKTQEIKSIGAKLNESDNSFEIFEVNGIKLAFLAYTYSLNQFTLEDKMQWKVNFLRLNTANVSIDEIAKDVINCRQLGAEFIICSLHCGNAYQVYPSQQTIDLYQNIFSQCGVDVIAGGHPHNLQPWKSYSYLDANSGKQKTGFAIYSLGDFIAYDIYSWCHLCAYVKLEIGRNSDGEVVFKPTVRPLVMLRQKNELKLDYAERVFYGTNLSDELKHIKVLYEKCMEGAGSSAPSMSL
jgi:poly-gamma-glutamate capsule biosynthesis protein CapA/YwtB (metallophosphatase superfamily)